MVFNSGFKGLSPCTQLTPSSCSLHQRQRQPAVVRATLNADGWKPRDNSKKQTYDGNGNLKAKLWTDTLPAGMWEKPSVWRSNGTDILGQVSGRNR